MVTWVLLPLLQRGFLENRDICRVQDARGAPGQVGLQDGCLGEQDLSIPVDPRF